MDEHGDALARARQAQTARDWPAVAAHFESVPSEQLTPDDLSAYFEAVLWLGRSDDVVRVGAAAYEALLADSRPVEAVRLAVFLG